MGSLIFRRLVGGSVLQQLLPQLYKTVVASAERVVVCFPSFHSLFSCGSNGSPIRGNLEFCLVFDCCTWVVFGVLDVFFVVVGGSSW